MDIEVYAKYHPKTKPGVVLPETILAIETLPENSRILDIGCAEGNTIQWLRSAFPDRLNFLGVDLSSIRIEKAISKEIERSVFRVGNAENLPVESSFVDYVLASQVIEHVGDDIQMLKEIDRVLVPGGKFQIDTVYKKRWAFYFYRAPSGWALDPTHLREYTNIDSFISKFPSSLKVENIKLQKCYRALNIISFFSFLPNWIGIPIPGYFTLFISGSKL